MAFQAKLFINDEERNVLDSTFLYQQLIDSNGRPKTSIQGGKISVLIESTKNDELFYDWMFSTHTMYEGYVRFYKRDGYSKLFDFEFANCHCIHLEEKFNAEGNSPLKMELVLSPGIQKVRGQIFEKNWNPSNPFENATPVTEREEDIEPEMIESYYEDKQGNRIPENKVKIGDEIYLVLKTKNAIGKLITIDLADNSRDFEYNGEVLEDDTLEGISINSDTQRITLKVVPQQTEAS
ncbi:type VI secretion system tube protein TssD [uncultured Aquimarina sp.]|uniref:type VI secretion system tube protein TssD n=1 Tax=uncultured Aquimarina sp. TaxID=575652 RepID=UPI002604D9C8|nr:type VI secretion system tube protein TssD [uncultured Aquimarina sp.]